MSDNVDDPRTIGERLDEIERLLGRIYNSVNRPTSCNHLMGLPWRDDRTGRTYSNCSICGAKVEV